MTLHEIALTTKTDRVWHDYCRTYDELFTPLRDFPVRLLEMGVLGGDGLLMWSKYFTNPDAIILGTDIEPWNCQPIGDSRVSVFGESQTNPAFFAGLPQLDIAISDAGHFSSHDQVAFQHCWPLIVPGGYYCCEDLHTYASPQHTDSPENIMQFWTRIATEIQGRGASACAAVEVGDLHSSIDTIMFRKGLVILRKAR